MAAQSFGCSGFVAIFDRLKNGLMIVDRPLGATGYCEQVFAFLAEGRDDKLNQILEKRIP